MSHTTCNVSCTMYPVTHVAFCRSPVICHLSLMPKATATDPPPANSPTMHSRMVGKDQKNQNKNLNKREREKKCKSKMSRGRPNLRLRSLTRSLQSTGKRCLQTWTDRQTGRSRISQLIDWISLGANSVKKIGVNLVAPIIWKTLSSNCLSEWLHP